MIDPSTCDVTAASHWVKLSWRLFHLLQQQQIILPLLAGLIATRWILPWRRLRRVTSRLGVILLITYLLGSTPVVANLSGQGLAALIPSDTGETADAIVVLGRGKELRPSRAKVAADLWQQGRAPQIFASGRGDAIEIGQLLEKKGVSASSIDGEPCSATTNENAEFTASILQPQGVKRIILVTDPPHMMRSVLTFQSLGFQVVPHSSPIPAGFSRKRETFLVFREWAGLLTYGMMGRYFTRQAPQETFKTEVPPITH